MRLFWGHTAETPNVLTSDIAVCLQRLERAQAESRDRIDCDRYLGIFAANIVNAGQAMPMIDAAIERVAQSMRRPEPSGRPPAGSAGLALLGRHLYAGVRKARSVQG